MLLKALSIVASNIKAIKMRIMLPPIVSCDAFAENMCMYCCIIWPNSGTKLVKIKSWIKVENSCSAEILPKNPNITVNKGTSESKDVKASDDATCIPFDK